MTAVCVGLFPSGPILPRAATFIDSHLLTRPQVAHRYVALTACCPSSHYVVRPLSTLQRAPGTSPPWFPSLAPSPVGPRFSFGICHFSFWLGASMIRSSRCALGYLLTCVFRSCCRSMVSSRLLTSLYGFSLAPHTSLGWHFLTRYRLHFHCSPTSRFFPRRLSLPPPALFSSPRPPPTPLRTCSGRSSLWRACSYAVTCWAHRVLCGSPAGLPPSFATSHHPSPFEPRAPFMFPCPSVTHLFESPSALSRLASAESSPCSHAPLPRASTFLVHFHVAPSSLTASDLIFFLCFWHALYGGAALSISRPPASSLGVLLIAFSRTLLLVPFTRCIYRDGSIQYITFCLAIPPPPSVCSSTSLCVSL